MTSSKMQLTLLANFYQENFSMGYIGQKAGTLWWHTALHVIASFLLFVPALILAQYIVELQRSFAGYSGQGGFFTVGYKIAIANAISVGLPRILLRKSNAMITATIFALIFVFSVIFVPHLVLTFPSREASFYGWLDFFSVLFCGVFGAFVGAQFNKSDLP